MGLEEPDWSLGCGGVGSNVVVVEYSIVGGNLRLDHGSERDT